MNAVLLALEGLGAACLCIMDLCLCGVGQELIRTDMGNYVSRGLEPKAA